MQGPEATDDRGSLAVACDTRILTRPSSIGSSPRRLAIFGSTGSIGRSTLEVAARHADRLRVVALSTHSRIAEAIEQCRQFHPHWLIVTSPDAKELIQQHQLPGNVELLLGAQHLEHIARSPEVDTLVAAIVGIAGLRGAWSAIAAGKRVALANKETLVAAGPLVRQLARRSQAEILPVDSEHSAIFQALRAGQGDQIRRILLTASGGPFRNFSPEQLHDVCVAEALQHPTWKMGRKITVDSATMMNKALEIIEARWLFDIAPEKIEVLIHPQSIVHSMVEFVDGSVVAQMSPPDMRLPIQYALSFPERWPAPSPPWELPATWQLEFETPDLDRFPALALGFQAARQGGTTGVVLNAANEAAVAAFLSERIPFREIVTACQAVVGQHEFHPQPDLEQLFVLDQWARKEITRWIGS